MPAQPTRTLPPEPQRESFSDEDSFLEARSGWQHSVAPLLAMARSMEARKRNEGQALQATTIADPLPTNTDAGFPPKPVWAQAGSEQAKRPVDIAIGALKEIGLLDPMQALSDEYDRTGRIRTPKGEE